MHFFISWCIKFTKKITTCHNSDEDYPLDLKLIIYTGVSWSTLKILWYNKERLKLRKTGNSLQKSIEIMQMSTILVHFPGRWYKSLIMASAFVSW